MEEQQEFIDIITIADKVQVSDNKNPGQETGDTRFEERGRPSSTQADSMEQAPITKHSGQIAHSNQAGIQASVCSFGSPGALGVLEADQNLTNISSVTGPANSQFLSFNTQKDRDVYTNTTSKQASFFSADARVQLETSQEHIGALEQTRNKTEFNHHSDGTELRSYGLKSKEKTYFRRYIDASSLQAIALNKLASKGFKFIAQDEVGKPLFPDFVLPKEPQQKLDVVISGERATSRQIAMKEREARKKQESEAQFLTYFTPAKKQKKAFADNPQQADEQKAKRKKKKEQPTESTPQLAYDPLLSSFVDESDPKKYNWAVFTRCQQVLSRVQAKSEELHCTAVAGQVQNLLKEFQSREVVFDSSQELVKRLRSIICTEIAKQKVSRGPLQELYQYFTSQIELADVEGEIIFDQKNNQKKKKKSVSKKLEKYPSSQSDSALDSNLLASSESDSQEQRKTPSQASVQQVMEPKIEQVQPAEQIQEVPRSNTRIVLKVAQKQELSDEQKLFLAENVGRLNQRASEGVRDIVKDHITPDENGNLDFELESIPYETSLTLFNYVKHQVRLETNREKDRQKRQERRRQQPPSQKSFGDQPRESLAQSKTHVDQPEVVQDQSDKISQYSTRKLSEHLEAEPQCYDKLTEQQQDDVANYRSEQQQELIEQCDGDVQMAKQKYNDYLMAIPGSSTLKRHMDKYSDDERSCRSGANSVANQTKANLQGTGDPSPVPKTILNQNISPDTKALLGLQQIKHDSESSSSSDSDSDDGQDSVLGKRTYPKAFDVSPAKDITALWNQIQSKK